METPDGTSSAPLTPTRLTASRPVKPSPGSNSAPRTAAPSSSPPASGAPLLLAAPGLPAGRHRRLVEFVDLYPTLAELCGLPAPANLEGLSAVPQLRRPARTIRTEQWRCTEWDETHRGVELYDVRKDSSEIRNLAANPTLAPVQADLARRLRAGWRAALPSPKS